MFDMHGRSKFWAVEPSFTDRNRLTAGESQRFNTLLYSAKTQSKNDSICAAYGDEIPADDLKNCEAKIVPDLALFESFQKATTRNCKTATPYKGEWRFYKVFADFWWK